MSEQEPVSGGLMGALQRLGSHGLELVQLRLSLLGTELEAEKQRLMRGLLGLLLVVLLLGATLVLFSLTLLLLTPDAWRWASALGLALLNGLGAWLLWQRVQTVLSAPGGIFATSLAELQRDRDSLGGE